MAGLCKESVSPSSKWYKAGVQFRKVFNSIFNAQVFHETLLLLTIITWKCSSAPRGRKSAQHHDGIEAPKRELMGSQGQAVFTRGNQCDGPDCERCVGDRVGEASNQPAAQAHKLSWRLFPTQRDWRQGFQLLQRAIRAIILIPEILGILLPISGYCAHVAY